MRYTAPTPEQRKIKQLTAQYEPLVLAAIVSQLDRKFKSRFTWIDKAENVTGFTISGGTFDGKYFPFYLTYRGKDMNREFTFGEPMHTAQQIIQTIAEDLAYQPHRYA